MEVHRVVFIVEWLLKGDIDVHPLSLIKLDKISERSYQDICHIHPLTLTLPNLVTGSFVAGRIEAHAQKTIKMLAVVGAMNSIGKSF